MWVRKLNSYMTPSIYWLFTTVYLRGWVHESVVCMGICAHFYNISLCIYLEMFCYFPSFSSSHQKRVFLSHSVTLKTCQILPSHTRSTDNNSLSEDVLMLNEIISLSGWQRLNLFLSAAVNSQSDIVILLLSQHLPFYWLAWQVEKHEKWFTGNHKKRTPLKFRNNVHLFWQYFFPS